MKKYIVVSDDNTAKFTIEAETTIEAALKALAELGWRVIEDGKDNSNKPQVTCSPVKSTYPGGVCQRGSVSQVPCRRKASKTRVTSKGCLVRLCEKCDTNIGKIVGLSCDDQINTDFD
jgi:hypothetical protein